MTLSAITGSVMSTVSRVGGRAGGSSDDGGRDAQFPDRIIDPAFGPVSTEDHGIVEFGASVTRSS